MISQNCPAVSQNLLLQQCGINLHLSKLLNGSSSPVIPNALASPHPFGKEKSLSHPLHSTSFTLVSVQTVA